MDDIRYGSFSTYAVCKCGWRKECPFGSLHHLINAGMHIKVCPVCGEDKFKSMSIKVMRPMYRREKRFFATFERFIDYEEKDK
jgi:hypothetical protein